MKKFFYIFLTFLTFSLFIFTASAKYAYTTEPKDSRLLESGTTGLSITLCKYEYERTEECRHYPFKGGNEWYYWLHSDDVYCKNIKHDVTNPLYVDTFYLGFTESGHIELSGKVIYGVKKGSDFRYKVSDNQLIKVGGDHERVVSFGAYGICPSVLSIDPGGMTNTLSYTYHDGNISFGNYGTVCSGNAWIIPVACENDIYILQNDEFPEAFTKADSRFNADFVKNLNAHNAEYCNVTSDEDYKTLMTALDNYEFFLTPLVMFTSRNYYDKMLHNNAYVHLAQSVYDNFGDGGFCTTTEFYTEENKPKYDALYKKAASLLDKKPEKEEFKDINDCEGILGIANDDGKSNDPNGDGKASFAYYLQQTLSFIKILVPALIIALSVFDYSKAITSGDKDIIGKVNKKTITRVVVGIIVFLTPTIIKAIFTLLNVYGSGNCGIQ